MGKFMKKYLVLLQLCLFSGIFSVFAGEKPAEAIYVILDGSGSMWQKLADGEFKIAAAKRVLNEFMQRDFEGFEMAFRAYGHRRKGDCRDSELIIPFGKSNAVIPKLTSFLKTVNPTGKTPISYSLRAALKDFGDRKGEIILISDGIETCDEDPCELVRLWREKNVQIKVHVVGLGLDEKSKNAMRCISDAAGTDYYDAGSATELAEGLKKIQERAVSAAFKLRGFDAEGNSMGIEGVLSQNGKEKFEVTSNGRFRIDSGKYQLTAGVRTRNGSLYKPVTDSVQIAESGETIKDVTVAVPPSVKAKFTDDDEKQRGSQVTAYQNGKEVFHFRWIDEVYLDEGEYEFRAKPNQENELSVTETFAAGDHKTIEFKMVHTVYVYFKLLASGSGIQYRHHCGLWQNGEKKYRVHSGNGARGVLPGTYDLHLESDLTPYIKENVVITEEDKQNFEIIVPSGHVTFIYQNADGSRDKDKRVFLGRGTDRQQITTQSGKKIALIPGTYNAVGWRKKRGYEKVVFEINAGEEKEVVLRAKQ